MEQTHSRLPALCQSSCVLQQPDNGPVYGQGFLPPYAILKLPGELGTAPLSCYDSRSLMFRTVTCLVSAPSCTQQHFREYLEARGPVLIRETNLDLKKRAAWPLTALASAPVAVPQGHAPVLGCWSLQHLAKSKGESGQQSNCPGQANCSLGLCVTALLVPEQACDLCCRFYYLSPSSLVFYFATFLSIILGQGTQCYVKPGALGTFLIPL